VGLWKAQQPPGNQHGAVHGSQDCRQGLWYRWAQPWEAGSYRMPEGMLNHTDTATAPREANTCESRVTSPKISTS
jgi:hypothetical protein